MRKKYPSSNNLRRRRKTKSFKKKSKSVVVYTSKMKQEREKKIERDIQHSLRQLARSHHFKIFRFSFVGFFLMTFISYKLLGRKLIADFFSGKLTENRTDYKTTPEEDKVYFILSMLLIGFISVTNILLMQVIKAEKIRRLRQENANKMSAEEVQKMAATSNSRMPLKTEELSGQKDSKLAQVAIVPPQLLGSVVCDEPHAGKKQEALTVALRVPSAEAEALHNQLNLFFDAVLSCCHVFHEELKKEASPQAMHSSQKSWNRLLQLEKQWRKKKTKLGMGDEKGQFLKRILDFEQRLTAWFKKVKKTGLYAQSNSAAMELERKKQFFIKLNRLTSKTMETVVDLRTANSLAREQVLTKVTRKITVFKCGLAPFFFSFREHWDQMSRMMEVSSSEDSDGQVQSEKAIHVRPVAASLKEQSRESDGSVSLLSKAANTVSVKLLGNRPHSAPGAPTVPVFFGPSRDRGARVQGKRNNESVGVSDGGLHRKGCAEPFRSVELCQEKGREPDLDQINGGQLHRKAILRASRSIQSDRVDGGSSDYNEVNQAAESQCGDGSVVCTGGEVFNDRMPEESIKSSERWANSLPVTMARQAVHSTGRSGILVRPLHTSVDCIASQVGMAQGENIDGADRQARAFHRKHNAAFDSNKIEKNEQKQQGVSDWSELTNARMQDSLGDGVEVSTQCGRAAVSSGIEASGLSLSLFSGWQLAQYQKRDSSVGVRWSGPSDTAQYRYKIVTHPKEVPLYFEPVLSWHPVTGVDAEQARDKFKYVLVLLIEALQKAYERVYLKGLQCSFLRSTFQDVDLHVGCTGSGWGGVDRILKMVHQHNGVIVSDCTGVDYRSVSIDIFGYQIDLTFSTATLEQVLRKSNTFVTASGMRPLTVDGDSGRVIAGAMQLAVPEDAVNNTAFKRWDQARCSRCCEVQEVFMQSTKSMLAAYSKGNFQLLMKLKKRFCFVLKMAVRHEQVSSQCIALLMLLSRAISFSMLVDAYCINYLGYYQSNLMHFLEQHEQSPEFNVRLWASIVKEQWFGFLQEQGFEPSNPNCHGQRFFSIQSPRVLSPEAPSSMAVPE